MKKFLFKSALFIVPFTILPLIIYLIIDPFKVLHSYSGEQETSTEAYQMLTNRDYQSTELFVANYKKYNYDSYIFGNSRSFFYRVTTWNKLTGGNGYHFNASGEGLFGVERKLDFINKLNRPVKNALIIIDYELLSITTNRSGHLFIKDPVTSGESVLAFHYEMFKGFYPKGTVAFIDLYLTHKKKKYMEKFGIRDNALKHDATTNQLTYSIYDNQIKTNPYAYYASKVHLFYKRDSVQRYSPPVISAEQIKLLVNIKQIFDANKTNCKIIVSPLYDQIKLNQADINYLNNLFGKENVFDFSGINTITSDYHNYYEASHYRSDICDSLLTIVYTNNLKTVPKL